MNMVGIVGGLGPESTVEYYQSIISKYQNRLGSKEVLPELFINSINMYQVFDFISNDNLQGLANYLVAAIQKLEIVGADFAVISANTPHIVFDQVQQQINIPLFSIVKETALKAEELGVEKIGLLGTKFTMENDFFMKPFLANNIEVVVPHHSEQAFIHQKIVRELENGIIVEETKKAFLEIIRQMQQRDHIEAIILGCTELPLIIQDNDTDIPSLNTTEIHINKIIEMMFAEKIK